MNTAAAAVRLDLLTDFIRLLAVPERTKADRADSVKVAAQRHADLLR